MAYDTLEEAQARILELDEQVATLTSERDLLSENNNNLTAENENLRKVNQNYFNRLVAQDTAEHNDDDEEDEDVPTCEEFAKTLDI